MKQKIKYTILYALVLLVLAYNLYVVMQLDKELKEGFEEVQKVPFMGIPNWGWGLIAFVGACVVIGVPLLIYESSKSTTPSYTGVPTSYSNVAYTNRGRSVNNIAKNYQ
jgi:hypothetical protein